MNEVCQRSLKKWLILTGKGISTSGGFERVLGRPEMVGRPVIACTEPWEKDASFVDSSMIIYDEEESLFKAWYQGGSCQGPDDGSLMCYAVSTDGVNWQKPKLGIIEFDGSKDNNIVFRASCMMHDPANIIDLQDPDPNRRHKAIWWGGKRDPESGEWVLGHCVGFSPDGIHWVEDERNPVWKGDGEVAVPFGLYHEGGKYVMYNSADGHGSRVVARSVSDDFTTWSKPELVFTADELDPPGTEMAGLAGVIYEGAYIGMLWTIRNLPSFTKEEWSSIIDRNIKQGFFGYPIEMNNTRCRTMYTELVVSSDGVTWERPYRQPFLPMGEAGSFDEVISLGARPLIVGDEIFIYYTSHGRTKATPDVESEILKNWNVETGLAKIKLDRFAGLSIGSVGGTLQTEIWEFSGSKLLLNAEIAGSVKAEIVDAGGNAIEGFSSDACDSLSGDCLRHELSWAGSSDISRLRGREVQLRLHLSDVQIYSITEQ